MARRIAVGVLEQRLGMSERRACALVALARSSCRYHRQAADRGGLRERLRVLAHARTRFGYRRLQVLLRPEGFRVNHKCVYRLYRQEGLVVRRKLRKRVARPTRLARNRIQNRLRQTEASRPSSPLNYQRKKVSRAGFEPATLCLKGRCSAA